MEQPGEFVSEIKKEIPRTPSRYIAEEIESDMSVFPEEAQDALRRFLDGGSLNTKERSLVDMSIYKWWFNKYGFPYTKKAARTEVIMRKYAKPEEIAEVRTLQEELLGAFQEKNKGEIARLKQEYQEKYPDQLEGVEIIFGFENSLNDQEIVNSYKKEHKSFENIRDVFQSLTEYKFLLTHFVHSNRNDRAFLEKFWAVLEALAKKGGGKDLYQFLSLQRSTATQVATMRLFEEAGFNPHISHPAEDAFHAIDLWVDAAAVQIKGDSKKEAGISFFETGTVAFPGVGVGRKARRKFKKQAARYHINSYLFYQAQKFHVKLSRYREFTQKDIRGYFLIVPEHKVDLITGEPTPDLIQLIKERVNTELQ